MKLLELNDVRYHPRELGLVLPEAGAREPASLSGRPVGSHPRPNLSRLSGRTRALISRGDRGVGSPYQSRSEADFAVCIAVFAAGFSESEAWAVMTDPVNGISEKYLEKGHHGDAYLALTLGKARALTRGAG